MKSIYITRVLLFCRVKEEVNFKCNNTSMSWLIKNSIQYLCCIGTLRVCLEL